MVRFHFLIMSIVVLFLSFLFLGSWSQPATAQIITNVTSYASPEYFSAPALVENASSHGDRDYTWTGVPASVLGLEYVLTANDDHGNGANPLFTITVSQNATVYLLWNDNVTLESWASGYTDTGDNLTNFNPANPVGGLRTYSVYSQDFVAGTINFGPQPGADRMYALAVKPSGPAPTPSPTWTPGPPPSSAENWKLYR